MKTKALIAAVLLIAVFAFPLTSQAASPWTEQETYMAKTGGKLEFGLMNLLLGWTDLYHEPYMAAVENRSVLLGLGKGIVDSIINMVGGAVHLVTFPIPLDCPLPDNGVQFS